MNTGISPDAKWFTLCLPFFQYLFFHCKFTISISVSVCRCKSKVYAKVRKKLNMSEFLSHMHIEPLGQRSGDADVARRPFAAP